MFKKQIFIAQQYIFLWDLYSMYGMNNAHLLNSNTMLWIFSIPYLGHSIRPTLKMELLVFSYFYFFLLLICVAIYMTASKIVMYLTLKHNFRHR